MGERLNLALSLEGRAKPAPENEQLVAIADALANLPDPQIDANFMRALEQRLLTEELQEEQVAANRPLQVVPAEIPAAPEVQPVRRSPVVQMPRRRFTARRSLVAMAAAASLAAFPVAAAAQALPGSPFYGLKTGIERVTLAVFGTPLQDAARHLDLFDKRLAEVEQLIARGADANLIDATLTAGEEHLRAAERLTTIHATDEETLLSLATRAAEAEQRLWEVRAVVAPQSAPAVDTAIETSVDIQRNMGGLLGIEGSLQELDQSMQGVLSPRPQTMRSSSQDSTSSTPRDGSDGTKEPSGSGDEEEPPSTTKKLSEQPEGCHVPGSGDGLGDALAPVARLMCT